MPKVIAYHDVKDRDHWLTSAKRGEFFSRLGVTDLREFVDPTNPNRVGISMDVPDLDALGAALETPEALEAEEHDGVIRESIVLLVEA